MSQFGEHGYHRQPANEFGDEAEAEQILRFNEFQDFVAVNGGGLAAFVHGPKTHHVLAQAALDEAFEPDEGAAADEQNIRGVHPDIFLLRVLAATLWRDIADGAFKNLQ